MNKSLSLSLDSSRKRIRAFVPAWYWDAVLAPFAISRVIYLLIAWFATYFFAFDHLYADRGYFLTPYKILDIWVRWDSAHYFSIITQGYQTSPDLTRISSNIAFFPLYPYLAKSIGWIIPTVPQSLYIVVGLLISNISFLVAAGLLYRLVADHVADETIATRTLLLLFAFPTSFIFSCFYTESLFLVLALACLTLALKNRWFWACLAAGLLAITRPPGILIALPLAWLYMRSVQWDLRKLHPDAVWFVLIPVPLALHLLSLYPKTGSLWAPLLAVQAWGRNGNLLVNLNTILKTASSRPDQIDFIAAVFFLVITLYGIWKLPARYLGVYALLLIILPVASGSIHSFTRYAVTVFPTFIMMAMLLKRRTMEMAILALFISFQAIYFLGWVNYYWID